MTAEAFGAGRVGENYPAVIVRRSGGACLACFRPALVNRVRRGRSLTLAWQGLSSGLLWKK
jgi:hypothetical protein